MSDTKKCSKCGEEKPATPEFFARQKNVKSGIRSRCKECRHLRHENNRQNNPYGIYKITHKETGKIYIGETINFNERRRRHKSDLKRQSHKNHLLQETFNSGGQDSDEIFEFEILEDWDIERKQEFDSEEGTKCPKYKLLKQELKKREAEVIKEYIQQGHDLCNWGIDAKTHSSIVAEKDAIIAEMREYLEARDEQGEEEEEDEIPRMESSRRG